MEVLTYWQDNKNCRLLSAVIGGGIISVTAHGLWRKRKLRQLKARLKEEKPKEVTSEKLEVKEAQPAGIFRGLALAGPHFSKSWFVVSSAVMWSSIVVISSYMMVKSKSYVNDYVGRLGGLVVKGLPIQPATYGFVLASLGAAAWNAVMLFSVDRLTLTIRGKITRRLHKNYSDPLRIRKEKFNVEQVIASDVHEFAKDTALLLQRLTIPVVSVSLYSSKLFKRLGPKPLVLCVSYIMISNLWLIMVVPTSSESAMLRSTYEGNFRIDHTRVKEYAEEIQFNRGSSKEQQLLDKSYSLLEQKLTSISNNTLQDNLLRGFFQRYIGILVSFLCILPSAQVSDSPTEFFLNSLHDLINVGSGLLVITKAMKDIDNLRGLSRRLLDLEVALKVVSSSPVPNDSVNLKLEGVTINSPDGKVLISQANFEVKPGVRCILVGPNGSGKSSLLRVLAGLWPVKLIGNEAVFEVPRKNFFVPQRAYLIPNFTPVEQILYPNNESLSHFSEVRIKECLTICGLSKILTNLNTPFPWNNLSGGQKELVCMCRAIFRLPRIKLLILDEAMSQVSKEHRKRILDYILKASRDQSLTLLIVSHNIDLRDSKDEYKTIEIKDGVILQDGKMTLLFEKQLTNTHKTSINNTGQASNTFAMSSPQFIRDEDIKESDRAEALPSACERSSLASKKLVLR